MKGTNIITLLTDFGITDPYVGMMKGVILSINPDARIVDLSHNVETGSVSQAAAFLREAYHYFPTGTIHVAVVDPGVGSERKLIGMESEDQIFIGPDNGIFWPIIEVCKPTEVRQLVEEKYFLPHVTSTFHGRDIFAPIAAHLSTGVDLKKMGPRLNNPVRLSYPVPKVIRDILYGQIIRVDHFGNLITNIYRTDLERFLKSMKPTIQAGNFTINQISRTYSEMEEGEPLAIINSSDQLELAVNLGRASQYIKITSGEIIGTQVRVRK
ncbi:MAG: SAM-dependent chlorinase/fluorinase [Deltaproteobacteria bacterium]|nr:SAM-dependent chlorinase/fluorinase [Deltaproteobacteria bacterium]